MDFSPEWDFTTGGSKVLICISPQLEGVVGITQLESKFQCSFGDSIVPVKFVQPGVLRCNAPPNPEPGFVPINLLYEEKSVNNE